MSQPNNNNNFNSTDSDPTSQRSSPFSNSNSNLNSLSTPIGIPSSSSSSSSFISHRRPSSVSQSSSSNSISKASTKTKGSNTKDRLPTVSPPTSPNAPRSSSRSRILASSDRAARDYEVNDLMRIEREKERERERERRKREGSESSTTNLNPDDLVNEDGKEFISSSDSNRPRSSSGGRPSFVRSNTSSSNTSGKGGSTIRRPSSSSSSSIHSSTSPIFNRPNSSSGFFEISRNNTTSPTIPEGFKDYSRRAKSPPIINNNSPQSPNSTSNPANLGLGLSPSNSSPSFLGRSPRERSFSSNRNQILEDVDEQKPSGGKDFDSPSSTSKGNGEFPSPRPNSISSQQSPIQTNDSSSTPPLGNGGGSTTSSPIINSSTTPSKQSLRSRLFGKKKKEEVNPNLTSLQIKSSSNSLYPSSISSNPGSSNVSIVSEDGLMMNNGNHSKSPSSSSSTMEKSRSFSGPKSAPANSSDFSRNEVIPPLPNNSTFSTGEKVASLSKRFGPMRNKSKNGKGKEKEKSGDGDSTTSSPTIANSNGNSPIVDGVGVGEERLRIPLPTSNSNSSNLSNESKNSDSGMSRYETSTSNSAMSHSENQHQANFNNDPNPISTSNSSPSALNNLNHGKSSMNNSSRPSTGTSLNTVSTTTTARKRDRDGYLSTDPNSLDTSYVPNGLKSSSQVSLSARSSRTVDGNSRKSGRREKERISRSNIGHSATRRPGKTSSGKEKEKKEIGGGLKRRSSWPPVGGVNDSFVKVKGGDPGSTTAGYRFQNAASGRSPISPNFSINTHSSSTITGLASPITIGSETFNNNQPSSIPPRPVRSPPTVPNSTSPRKRALQRTDRPFSSGEDGAGRTSSQILTIPSQNQRPRSFDNASRPSSNFSDSSLSSPPISSIAQPSSDTLERNETPESNSPTSLRSNYTMAPAAPPSNNSYFPSNVLAGDQITENSKNGTPGSLRSASGSIKSRNSIQRPKTADHVRSSSYSSNRSGHAQSPPASALSSPNRNLIGLPNLNVIPRSSSLIGHGGADVMSLSNSTSDSLGLPSPPPRSSSARNYSDLIVGNLNASQDRSPTEISPTVTTPLSGISPTTSTFSALRAKFGAAISAPLAGASQGLAAVSSSASGLASTLVSTDSTEVKEDKEENEIQLQQSKTKDPEEQKELGSISSRNQSQSSLNSTSHSEDSLGRLLDQAPLTPMNRSAISLIGSDGGPQEVLDESSQVGKSPTSKHLAPPNQNSVGLGLPSSIDNTTTPKLKTPSRMVSNHDGDLSSAFGSPASFHTSVTNQPTDESVISPSGRFSTPKIQSTEFLESPSEEIKGGTMPLLPPKSPLRYRRGQEVRDASSSSQDSMLKPTRIFSDPSGLNPSSSSTNSSFASRSARNGLGIDSVDANLLGKNSSTSPNSQKEFMKEPLTPSSITSTTTNETESDFGMQDFNNMVQTLEVGNDLERVSATSGAFEGMDIPPWSHSSTLPPVPASAKRTVSASAVMKSQDNDSSSKGQASPWMSNDGGIKLEDELTKSLSRSSQVDPSEISPSSAKKEFSSSTIGKRTPSIPKTWGKSRKSSKGKAFEGFEMEDEGNPLPPDSSNAGSASTHHTSSKRKPSRKWPFSKEVFSDGEDEPKEEKKSTSKTSSAFSLRSKKTETPVRPQIRRVFDPPIHDEDNNDASSSIGGDHDQLQEMVARHPSLSQQASLPSLRTRASIESQKSKGQFSEPGQSPHQGHHANSPSFSFASESDKGGVRRPLSSHGGDPRYPMGSPASVSTGGARLVELSPEQKRLVKRRNIIRELVETEKSYASDLAIVRDVYLLRARNKAGINNFNNSSTSNSLAGTPTGNSTPGGVPSPSINPPNSSSSSFFPARFPSSLGSNGSTAPSTPGGPSNPVASRHGQRQPSSESGPSNFNALNSPSSLASASTTSNRSSVYTVSSQSSQTSDPSAANKKDSSKSASNQPNGANPSSTKQTISVQTQSPLSGSVLQAGMGHSEAPLTPADIRIIFAGLEQCATFADEMAVQLEMSMGGYNPNNETNPSDKGSTQRSASIPRNVRGRNRTSSGGRLLNDEEELKEQEDDSIGETFLRLMPRIEQVYTAYCSRHEASMSRLQEVTNGSAKVAAFMRDCNDAARKQTNAWDLSSLLIKPVQRVLKYPLLIQEILSTTLPSHPDFESLKAAHVEIQQAADQINEVKRRRDAVLDSISSSKSVPKTPGGSKKLKRKGDGSKLKGPLLTGTSSDPTADNYQRLAAQVRDLEGKVSTFSIHVSDWVDQVRRTNKAQRRLLSQWRATYRVAEAEPAAEERLQAMSSLLRKQIDGPWQQLDSDLRSTILPMLARLGSMFQNPKAVMARRDIRESDYSKYRSSLNKSDKTPDRKLLESANAFVALHAQLLDELPQFIYGVQTLLDIGIKSLAKAQAVYFLSTKRGLIEYWKENGWGNETDITIDEVTQEPTMKTTSPVRQFWEAHREISGYAETLAICVPSAEDDEGSPTRSRFVSPGAASTSNLGHGISDDQSSLHPDTAAGGSSRLGVATSNLVRSISGTRSANSSLVNLLAGNGSSGEKGIEKLEEDKEEEDRPPSPPIKDIPIEPPSLPQLEFKSGFFIVEGSPKELPFLESLQGQPYDLSPSVSTKELPSVDDALEDPGPGSISKSDSAPVLSASSSASNNTATQGTNNPVSTSEKARHTRQRTQFKVVCTSAAVADSPKRDGSLRMGYPLLEFKVGDLLSLLSHDMEKSGYLFGRSESGQMGWAESDRFVELEK